MASANVCKVSFALEDHPQISGLKTGISFLAHYSVFHSPLTIRVLGVGNPLWTFPSTLNLSLYTLDALPLSLILCFWNFKPFFDKALVIASLDYFPIQWTIFLFLALVLWLVLGFSSLDGWSSLLFAEQVLRWKEDGPELVSVQWAIANTALSSSISFPLHLPKGAVDPMVCLLIGPLK